MNNVNLTGRLTRDPELRFLPTTGRAVANFVLAVDRNLSKEKKQELENAGQPTADFIKIVVFGKQAENCANYLNKGSLVGINGRIQTRSYEDTNTNKRIYVTEVVANRVEFLSTNRNSSNNHSNNQDDFYDGFNQVDDDEIPF